MTHSYYTELYPCFEWDDEPRTWEIEVVMEMISPGDPGKTYGLPEDCYPPEPAEWEVESIYLHATPRGVKRVELTMPQFYAMFGQECVNKILEAAEESANGN